MRTLSSRPLSLIALLISTGMAIGAYTLPSGERTGKLFQESAESDAPANDQTDDPVREPLFEGWDTPQVTLFISGRQNGYIEPCGCTGLENQLGGMMRRHTLFKQLAERGWKPVGLDLGNQVRSYGPQSILKINTTYEGLGFDMGYQCIGFGPDDLQLPTLDLMTAMTNSGLSTSNFVCANVSLIDPGFTSRFRTIQAGNKRIGVTMVLGDEHLGNLPVNADIRAIPVDQALAEISGQMKAARCDYYVLMALTSLEKCRALASAHPWFDLIVSGGVDGEPTLEPEEFVDPATGRKTRMIQTGYKGSYVGVVGFYDSREMPVRYQRVPLDARFEDSKEVRKRFLSYQRQLELLGLEGLQIKTQPHPSGRAYVGSDACADCHDYAYEVWKEGHDGEGGPHFRATLDLTDPGERTWVQRHHDPECLSCHVTGWNPQKYFPFQTGYHKLDDALLHGNGCENCHGPGSLHAAAENGDIEVDEATRVGYAKEMVVTLEQAGKQLCFECHDIDNSPDFHVEGAFEEYWEKIKHDEEE
jgi:Cytochrome c554 and c-prime